MGLISSKTQQTKQHSHLLLPTIIVIAVLVLNGLLAARLLRPTPPSTISQGQTVAEEIAQVAAQSKGVSMTSGTYVPGSGMLLYSRREQGGPVDSRTWVLAQLEPYRDQLAALPSGEMFTWWIDSGMPPLQQEVIQASLPRAADQASHRYLSPLAEGNAQRTDQGQMLALEIAAAATQDAGVTMTSGTYVPGRGMLLYSRREQGDAVGLRTWVLTQLEPYGDRLVTLPSGETFTWWIDYGTPLLQQEVVQAPLPRTMERTLHRYVSLPGQMEPQPVLAEVTQPVAAMTPEPAIALQQRTTPVPIAEVAETPPPAVAEPGVQAGTVSSKQTFVSTFEAGAPGWGYLSGEWAAVDGVYRQTDNTGFDYITMANTAPVSQYILEARLRTIDGNLGAGFVYNAPNLNDRANAMMVDLTEQGTAMRWGYYNERGDYIFLASAPISPPVADGNWHTLRLETRGAESTIYLNDQEVGVIQNQSTSGYVGLVTTQAAVEFDEVRLLPQASRD